MLGTKTKGSPKTKELAEIGFKYFKVLSKALQIQKIIV
jgi:hypothetical protein